MSYFYAAPHNGRQRIDLAQLQLGRCRSRGVGGGADRGGQLYACGRSSFAAIRKTASVTDHQRKKLTCIPVAWQITPRIRETAKEPTQVHTVGPSRNLHLVAAQEGNGRPDAMDRRLAVEFTSQIKAETFLRTTSDAHDNMPGTPFIDQL